MGIGLCSDANVTGGEIVAVPAGGRNVTPNTHQASVLLEPLTQRPEW